MRQLDAAFLHGDRAGKRAALVAEQLRLHQSFRQRRAIHADESAIAPRALLVQRLSDEFLADAAFAANDHVGRRARHALDGIEDVAHRVRGADQIAQRILAADFLAQDAVLALDVQFFDGALEQQAQHVRVNGLYEVVVTAGVNYFQRRVLGLVRAEHDHQSVDVSCRRGG